ncbi:MAG: DnaJ domain-containing protein [Polyangiaceae bacterium]|nr:DnaJ domain-containing protein [Polyangiaceae bacterium]
MTAAPIQNHYKVLRIERTADERAIKKAYFTLIREFPPDTHPEEFKSIREAYEVLSDPVARERYDNLDKDYAEYGDEVGAALKAVEEAEKSNAEAEVQGLLIELLDSHPDLLLAREKLALSYLRAETFEKALGTLDVLIEREPDQARHHLRKAVALHRLDKPEEAEKSLKKAYKLKPEDLDVALSYIKFLAAVDKPKKALKIVDESLERHPEGSPPNVILRLRRVHVVLLSDGNDAAQKEISALFDKAREINDPELFKFISSQLATIAAGCFARKEPAQANKILARCVEINPDSIGERPYPPRVTFDLNDLPAEGQAWLGRLSPGPQSPTVAKPVWVWPVLAILASIGLTTLFAFLAFDDPEPWSAGEIIAAALPVLGCVLALAFSARKAFEIVTSPLRAFFSIHPLYLVDVELRRVDLYPLFGLTDLQATHHHTNGAYSHTLITLTFDGKTHTYTIRGKEHAEGWIGYLLECRGRALELMAEGYLDAEQGIELLPPALLTQASAASKKRARNIRFYGGVAGLGLAVWALLIPFRAAKADDAAWRRAVRAGTTAAYMTYVREMPDGRHIDDAKRLGEKPFQDAVADFRAASKADAPLPKALIKAAEILHAAGETVVPLTLSITNNLPEEARPQAGPGSPLSLTNASAMTAALAAGFNRMLLNAGIGSHFSLATVDLWKGKPGAPIELVIEGEARADNAVLTGEGVPELPAPLIEWKVRLLQKGATEPLWSMTLAVPAPDEIRLPMSGMNTIDYVAERTVDAGYSALTRKIAQELGLPGAPLDGRAAGRVRRSPYLR